MTSTLARWPLIGFVLAHVRSGGGDADGLARRFSLAPGDDAEAVMPLSRFRAFVDDAAAAAGDDWLGLTLAASLPRGRLGLFEFASTSAATLRDGLARVVRYAPLINDAVALALDEDDDEARLTLRVPGEPECLGRHGNEFFLALLLAQARHATGDACVPSRAWLAHARPAGVAPLVAALGTGALAFAREENGVALPRALLDLPLARADAPLAAWLDARAAAALAALDGGGSFVARVRQAVRARLAAGAPTVAELARALAMSPRTLQRRLAAERTTFHALVDAVRADVALHQVRDGRRSLSEIAWLCGYSEPSAFLRAFKRWTGQRPSELRASSA